LIKNIVLQGCEIDGKEASNNEESDELIDIEWL
jgi:hypothetical protein